MKHYNVSIDHENNSDAAWDFWMGPACAVWDRVKGDGHGHVIEYTQDELDELKACPGWDHPDYPNYAPHPCVVEVIE